MSQRGDLANHIVRQLGIVAMVVVLGWLRFSEHLSEAAFVGLFLTAVTGKAVEALRTYRRFRKD